MKIQNASPIARRTAIAAALLFAVMACKTAEPAVDQSLKNDTERYAVKGRQGSLVGQTLSFGNFKTDKIKRGWTFSYSLPFIIKFNRVGEKLSFTQFDGNGRAADVALISRFRETELASVEEFFSVSLQYKNYCAGSIKRNDSESSWDFVVHNVDGAERSLQRNSTAGFIRRGKTRIEVTGIRELEGSSRLLTFNEVYGYEFRLDGKVIGAVSTINSGRVWFKAGLDDELKLVVASVSSGLMLRNSVGDQM